MNEVQKNCNWSNPHIPRYSTVYPKNAQLTVIDMQPRLVGAMHESFQKKLRRNVELLLRTARELDLPTIMTEQNPEKLGRTDPELLELMPLNGEPGEMSNSWRGTRFASKMTFSAMEEPYYLADLSDFGEREVVIICGVETHICVLMTAIELLSTREHIVLVAGDACASRDPEAHQLGLDAMRDAGVWVLPTEAIIYQLLRDCECTAFRNLRGYLK